MSQRALLDGTVAICAAKDPLTRRQAAAIARRMTRRYSRPLMPYLCRRCGHYHVGNKIRKRV